MKKLILGIGLLLFAILFQLCSTGLEMGALVIGLAGLCFCVTGAINKSE